MIVGLVLWIDLAPSSDGGAGSRRRGRGGVGPTPESQASTSARGVTASSINVVFPIVNLNSEAGKLGFAEDVEYGEQAKAINFFVNQVNEPAASTAARSTR